CFYALSASSTLDGISQLSRLRLRIKQTSAQKLITTYLRAAAKKQNICISALEDLAVPKFDVLDGRREWKFDDYTAVVNIVSVGKTNTLWLKPDGIGQKTMPQFVKDNFSAELKAMKEITKQIEQTLTAQRDRIDRMFRQNRHMAWPHFQNYFLNHPLVVLISKKMIWNFTENDKSFSAIFYSNKWVNAQNEHLAISENCTVSLWHPVISSMSETLNWRDFLIEHEIQQPLKQAFREIYLLTEAEIKTRTYSNRMAAHILKQHQFNTLVKVRGWSYHILGAWDGGDGGVSYLTLPEHNLEAEYWIDSVETNDGTSDGGSWRYVSTDKVRFIDIELNEVIELIDVPAIAFSEVMRDVDLFVGVSSVGNDPNWEDSGELVNYRTYWQTYAFGDLSEIAKTRKEALQRLLPKLKLKDITTIQDKFLVVKGKLRIYKIHIGSANILMEPNDQYLCIVPEPNMKDPSEELFLPFEGDRGLSIVLSKAFLLADDDKIIDTSITSQIVDT
ncbi:MAG: DUF4132 domain-containing protein, partial [Burkholderiaceae bacterium]|nr:DUF4132 domain-containing protein [Burkholderiaceae bacterium]